MSQSMVDPVYQRLVMALAGIADSIDGERAAYESFLGTLIQHEWAIKDRHGESNVDELRRELADYLELLEGMAARAHSHMDSVLDGAGAAYLCEAMDVFSADMKAKQVRQDHVRGRVREQLSAVGSFEAPEAQQEV